MVHVSEPAGLTDSIEVCPQRFSDCLFAERWQIGADIQSVEVDGNAVEVDADLLAADQQEVRAVQLLQASRLRGDIVIGQRKEVVAVGCVPADDLLRRSVAV